jgi:putative PEP-CTERM system histidine kinase
MPTLEDVGALSYALVAGLSGVFALLLLISWRGRAAGILLLVAALINVVWATAAAFEAAWDILPTEWIWVLESLRTLAWVFFLSHLLELQLLEASRPLRLLRLLQISILAVALILCLPFERWATPFIIGAEESLLQGRLFGHLLLIVVGLVLVEHVYRNTIWEHRKDIRFLCLGLGAMFSFDFYVYADAMLMNRIDPEFWLMRGPLNVFVIPLLANSAAHNPQWSVHLFVSRTIVFHTAALAATGAYLILMSLAGYWIRAQGDEWGSLLQVLFFLGAIGFLLVLFFSRDLRARLKVFIAKNFYRSKFDYRHEWIRVTRRLSGPGLHASLPERIVFALGEAVDRPGGAIWVADGQGRFRWETCVHCDKSWIDANWDATEFCRALERIGWILDLAEHAREPGLYPGLDVPPWMGDLRNFSLVVPILHDHRIPYSVGSASESFEAQSHGLHALCVRFAAGIAPGPRNTRFRRVASPYRSGTFTRRVTTKGFRGPHSCASRSPFPRLCLAQTDLFRHRPCRGSSILGTPCVEPPAALRLPWRATG